jgi:dethiobiotin synthetase
VKGVFVTGTDTGVGKTITCAALLHRYPNAGYWKPVQTGIEQDDDTAEVQRLSQCAVFDQGIRLRDPVSPHLAARRAGLRIDLQQIPTPPASSAWIVEGAGGVLVPVNETELMMDLLSLLALPVVIVARSSLGTINHTLLTLEALRARSLTVAGVILNGDPNPENREAIEHYGRVRVLGEMPRLPCLNSAEVKEWAVKHLDRGEFLKEYLV